MGAFGLTTLRRGTPFPLGATCTGGGVNFAVYSAHATRVVLCTFDPGGLQETGRYELTEQTDGVWHGHLDGAGAGLVYGYRAWGPVDHERGLRFNPAKLLLDPYARRLGGEFRWTEAHLDSGPHAPLDNARDAWKAVVTGGPHEAPFDWQDDRPPAIPMEDSVFYETHVKGYTRLHPEVPAPLRGTYEGFVAPAAIAHLKRLGVTAVDLLPVHQSVSEYPLVMRGLVNYWGYSTLAYFVPDRRFARTDPVNEFKTMVRELHRAGIEVILDVVYNHTAEGDQRGPTLSLRGLDNPTYYHLRRGHPGIYENYTGTGNSLDLGNAATLRLVMDSLRYWVQEMHVDGFRFDLATTLGRCGRGDAGAAFEQDAPFFMALRQDPVLARAKLIAEPWDVGTGGYQLGRFPPGWSEWNDRFRDSARSVWVSKASYRGDLPARLTGSPDVFRHGGRRPAASVNYVTSHDGFTLRDLVSYSHKHNEANGEDNHDGSSHNLSWNCGTEGPTDLLMVNALRSRLQRALLATLFLSRGVPLLLGGDELGRTQRGNNNAYCQDNEVSWYDWAAVDEELLEFTAWMIRLRREYPQLRERFWAAEAGPSAGRPADGRGGVVTWYHRDGAVMTPAHWQDTGRYVFGMAVATPGQPNLLLLLNSEAGDAPFDLPAGEWHAILDTGQRDGRPDTPAVSGRIVLKARSLSLLRAA
jgi:glycogen debranching enzyme GlgX